MISYEWWYVVQKCAGLIYYKLRKVSVIATEWTLLNTALIEISAMSFGPEKPGKLVDFQNPLTSWTYNTEISKKRKTFSQLMMCQKQTPIPEQCIFKTTYQKVWENG